MEISLALGGGGAKGIAHIGVLLRLEELGFRIRAVAGTSAGGIVATLYAAGFSPTKILEYFESVDQSSLYGRRHEDYPAILGIAGVNRLLNELLDERTFEDLVIPCALTAVDLYSEEEVFLSKGRLVDAILATIALPGIFPPKEWNGRYLVDGGLLDPVPVKPARSLAPKLPVAAVVLSDIHPQHESILEPPTFLRSSPLLRQFARLRLAQAFNIFIHSINISGRYLTMMRLNLDKPEVIIHPDVGKIGIFDRVDIRDTVRKGEIAVDESLDELKKATRWDFRLRRHFIRSTIVK